MAPVKSSVTVACTVRSPSARSPAPPKSNFGSSLPPSEVIRTLRLGWVASAATPASAADRDFYAGKLAACRWFFVHELPTIEHDAALLATLDRCVLDTPPDVL